MPKIFVAHVVPVEELDKLAARWNRARQNLQEAQAWHDECRTQFQMMVEIPENHKAYYGRFGMD